MSDITKEELMAMMDVQTRSATAMEIIANSIRQVSDQSKEIAKTNLDSVREQARVQAEVVKEAVKANSDAVKEAAKIQADIVKEAVAERERSLNAILAEFSKTTEQLKKDVAINKAALDKIKDDTGWLKIIIGSSTLIILVASVVIQFVMGSIQTRRQLSELELKIINMERQHLVEVK